MLASQSYYKCKEQMQVKPGTYKCSRNVSCCHDSLPTEEWSPNISYLVIIISKVKIRDINSSTV